MVIIFVILLVIFIGGGYFYIKRMKAKEIARRKKVAEIAASRDVTPVSKQEQRDQVLDSLLDELDKLGSPKPTSNPDGSTASSSPSAAPTSAGKVSPVATKPSSKPKPPPVKPAFSPAESASIVETLKTQMKAVVVMYGKASGAYLSYGAAVSEWRRASDSLTLVPDRNEESDPEGYIASGSAQFLQRLQKQQAWEEASLTLLPTATAAEKAWTTLAQTVKRLRKYDRETFAQDLHLMLLAAELVQDFFKEEVEALASNAAKNTPAKSAASKQSIVSSRYDGALVELTEALKAMVINHAKARRLATETKATFKVWKGGTETKFQEPTKPTEEEVGRYLQEVEQWAEGMLEKERSAAQSLSILQQIIPTFQKAIEAVTRVELMASANSSKAQTMPLEVRATILAATAMVDNARTSLTEKLDDVTKLSKHGLTATPPVLASKPEEAPIIARLRNQFRTLGYAIAQRKVASAKYGQVCSKKVDSPAIPECSKEMDIDVYLLSFAKYWAEETTADQQRAIIAAEVEQIKLAYEARQAKESVAAEAISPTAKNVTSQLTIDSTDELRVILGVANKLVAMHAKA